VRPAPDAGSRNVLDKLGVKPGMRVAMVAFEDASFQAQLAERGAVVAVLEPGLDMIFYRVGEPGELMRISELRPLIRDSGAIWVLRDKGADRRVREVDIIEAGRAFDLVDNKIASFSDTVAAMRLVVPLNHRRKEERSR
jgi:hypothetical protein